jgi:hypothetical protein
VRQSFITETFRRNLDPDARFGCIRLQNQTLWGEFFKTVRAPSRTVPRVLPADRRPALHEVSQNILFTKLKVWYLVREPPLPKFDPKISQKIRPLFVFLLKFVC